MHLRPISPLLVATLILAAVIPGALAASLEETAANTRIPNLELEGTSINEACAMISALTGIAIESKVPEEGEAKITLTLRNVSVKDAVGYVAVLGGAKVTYTEDSVRISK